MFDTSWGAWFVCDGGLNRTQLALRAPNALNWRPDFLPHSLSSFTLHHTSRWNGTGCSSARWKVHCNAGHWHHDDKMLYLRRESRYRQAGRRGDRVRACENKRQFLSWIEHWPFTLIVPQVVLVYPAPGQVEIVPGKLWDSVIATIRNAIKGTYTQSCIMHFKRNGATWSTTNLG